MRHIIVMSEVENVPCCFCGRVDLLTVGPPGAAVCSDCWDVERLNPSSDLYGVRSFDYVERGIVQGCRFCTALVGDEYV